MNRFSSVRAKLLLVFATSLAAVALVNVAMSAYLAARHGEADARTRLAQHLIQLQDDLQGARDDLRAVAQQTASDEKNLSDLAVVFSEEQALARQHDPVRELALRVHKAASASRLGVVVRSARLSSLAVYVDGALSHYAGAGEAGLTVSDGGAARALVRLAGDGPDRPLDRAPPAAWSTAPVAPRLPADLPPTAQFVFTPDDAMELRVVVPIQAVTRASFNETIAERLSPAPREAPPPVEPAAAPHVIGAFVFGQRFGRAFLERFAERTGIVPAVLSIDGAHRLTLIEMPVPPGDAAGQADGGLPMRRVDVGSGSFYQATRRWRQEQGQPLVLGAAVSTEGTTAGVRRTVGLAVVTAALALAAGLAVGSASITRMVTPIKALTAAAASMGIAAAAERPASGSDDALQTSLGRYLDAPVSAASADEVGTLARAFNAMAARLFELVDRLQRSNEALRRAEADLHHLNVGLEQQVRDRTAQLEIANNELESFSYSVSHDLRAPLRGLDGFSRALLEDYDQALDDTGRDYLRRIRRASQQMGQLIDDLLDLARVTRMELIRARVDLSGLAQAIVDELRAAEPSRAVETVVAPGLEAWGDQRLLQIVLRNLLHNAWKFTGSRPVARIECGQAIRDGARAFFVRDNGVGFDAAYAHKLFGAFQRLHSASEFPGTGVGLATVQRIVVRHGGRVGAESHADGGATFFFTLPDAGPGTP